MIGFFAFMLAVVLGGLVLAGGLQLIRAGGRRGSVRQTVHSPGQLDRIETALASLEARVDDLQDQQRFLERLLADRPEPPRLTAGGGEGRRGGGEGRTPSDDSVLFDTRPATDATNPKPADEQPTGEQPADEGER